METNISGYNPLIFSLNGVPACANKKLLTDILRTEWKFTGYVVSDESAIENIINDHHYLTNNVDTVAACVNAGCNLELSPNLITPVYLSLCMIVLCVGWGVVCVWVWLGVRWEERGGESGVESKGDGKGGREDRLGCE